jgi:hypothetical protein
MIKINRYKTLSQAMTRLSHNKRKKSFDKQKMIGKKVVLTNGGSL